MRFLLFLPVLLSVFACGAKSGLKVPVGRLGEGPPDASNDGFGIDGGDMRIRDIDPLCFDRLTSSVVEPVDIFALVDRSDSMGNIAGNGLSKIETLREAFGDFFARPGLDGVGASLFYFPSFSDAPRGSCFDSSDCVGNQVCDTALARCDDPARTSCSDVGCAAGFRCETMGRCCTSSECSSRRCDPRGAVVCGMGETCEVEGICFSVDSISCQIADYELPRIPLMAADDPATAPVWDESLRRIEIEGSTPTLPALAGVIERAVARRTEIVGGGVAVLLATDGIPSACEEESDVALPDPTPPAVAAQGLERGVRTFVIGVLTGEGVEQGEANLSAISSAGGSNRAVIVDESQRDVGQRLSDAIDGVRRQLRTCSFQISGDDFERMTLVLPDEDGELTAIPLPPRELAENCGAGEGFYRVPEEDRRGFGISLCPASCAAAIQPGAFVARDRC